MSPTFHPPSGSAALPASPHEQPSARRVLKSVALLLARHEIRSLRRWFDDFDRDILLPILLGEIALHNIGAFENHREPAATTAAPAGQVPSVTDMPLWDGCSFRPCNAYSISAATNLPRETVRRKIARLVELGWVTRRDNGHLYVTAVALEHFGSLLSSRGLGELLDTADRVRKLLAEQHLS